MTVAKPSNQAITKKALADPEKGLEVEIGTPVACTAVAGEIAAAPAGGLYSAWHCTIHLHWELSGRSA